MQQSELFGEYNQKASDSKGNEYRVQKFLFFSWVKAPDGSTLYKQSGIVILSLIFILISAVFTVIFLILRFMQGDLYIEHGLIMKRHDDNGK